VRGNLLLERSTPQLPRFYGVQKYCLRLEDRCRTSCLNRFLPSWRQGSLGQDRSRLRSRWLLLISAGSRNRNYDGEARLTANISNCLACEMPSPTGTREDEIFRIAAAQLLKKVERCCRYADSADLHPVLRANVMIRGWEASPSTTGMGWPLLLLASDTPVMTEQGPCRMPFLA